MDELHIKANMIYIYGADSHGRLTTTRRNWATATSIATTATIGVGLKTGLHFPNEQPGLADAAFPTKSMRSGAQAAINPQVLGCSYR
jgi:hypothetical protein